MFINFSDAAKFADIARNLILNLGYGNSFTFWGNGSFDYYKQIIFPAFTVPPIMPFSIAVFFKMFGVNDLAVIATSIFYFLLTLFFVFLLARKIFKSNLVGVLSTLAIGLNKDLINYAIGGASESPFIFEIVTATYLVSLKKKWATILSFLLLTLMYFTRSQAFIYIAGIILFWLLNNYRIKKAIIYIVAILGIGILIDRLFLLPVNGKTFLYSITSRGINSALSQTYSTSASDALRGGSGEFSGMMQIAKNVFYNLYNYFKLLPEIVSPYLFALFIIGIFIRSKDKVQKSFKIASLFMITITFLVAAASIPFFRYIHPVVPLIYIIATGTLVELISNYQLPIFNQVRILKLKILKNLFIILISLFIILLFGVGQTVGTLLLDSRFEAKTHNVGKPPVYVVLSQILKENTKPSDVIVTNLDTWGSWYGQRKTVWFPIEPKQLIDPATNTVPFNAIYLTSYMMDDENYYMGSEWRLIFDNPKDSSKWTCEGCSEITKEYSLKGVYTVSANDNYERQNAKAVLLVKKK